MQKTIDFVFIIASVLIAIAIFYSVLRQWEYGKKRIKYSLVFIFMLCGFGVCYHACKQSLFHAKVVEFQKAFKNNETIICFNNQEEFHVHRTTFVYFPDLFSFVGKDGLKGVNIPISSCNQHIVTHDSEILND